MLLSTAVLADDRAAVVFVGRPVADVIDQYRGEGFPFAYSTSLVTDDIVVLSEPVPGTPLEIVTQILQPHGLTVRTEAGVFLVVRSSSAAKTADNKDTAVAPGQIAQSPMETVIVSASRYAISRDISASRFSIDQRTIQNMPDIGEDPLRVTQRLPGTAASGASAVAHFRGGEQGEVGIMLNGQWLFDPYHIRDYQNIFSAIDARAIDGVEVYTGGYPVRFGDRMSGLVLMDSLDTEAARHNEIGISVFNTSLLTAGRQGKSNWLFSARRGNLDLVIDPRFGRPAYFDVFGEFAYEITPDSRLSVNTLYADDAVEVVLESDLDERDQVGSETRNAQFWVRLDNRWSDQLSSTTVISALDYSNLRQGFTNDREKMVAEVRDHREVQQMGFRQDWLWNPSDRHLTQWGVQLSAADAKFNYRGEAEYFGLPAIFDGSPPTIDRAVVANPNGGSYAFYVSDRWQISERTIVEWGLRWDDQTYTELSSDSQLSPRFSLLHRPWQRTELRFSIGRYFQSQPIQSLQVEDGVSNYWPAQRADHIIVGLQRQFSNETTLRIELFHKDIGQVRPRFENLFDPLGLMPELQYDRVRLAPSSATARGVELSANRVAGKTSWWASYTWSKVEDRIAGIDVARSWDQRHAVQGGIDWNGDKWQFSTAASIHSGWPTTDLTLTDDIAVPGPRNTQQHDLFASLDFRLSRKFDVRRGSLLVFVEVSNVTNRRNACCLDWDVGENSAGDDVLERGKDYWMPLLPAIGVLWEF